MPAWNVHFGLTVDLSNAELVALNQRALALASVIRDIPIPPHLQLRLDSLNIMRAVRGTTAIEGADVSTEEVANILATPNIQTLSDARQRDEQEVRNAREVMFFVANILSTTPDHPVTQELICKLHELTTKKIAYEHNVPGSYRSHAVSAGEYRPPSTGEEVRRLMDEFIEWFRSPPAINWGPVVRALVGHFYLISIHPFGDGNGRTSRALESFLLYQGHVNARGFYSLANFYYHNRPEYVWQLDNARFNSAQDLTSFVMFGLRGLVEELEVVHRQVLDEVKLISYRDYARDMFLHRGRLGTKAGERLFHFLIALGRDPMPIGELTTRRGPVSSLYKNVSQRTIQRDMAFLRDEGLITMDDGHISANLDVMEQFTALKELQQSMSPDAVDFLLPRSQKLGLSPTEQYEDATGSSREFADSQPTPRRRRDGSPITKSRYSRR